MKILHINDLRYFSGAEKIYRQLFEDLGGEKITLGEYTMKSKIGKYINKFFFSYKTFRKIRKTLTKYNPDVILLHNINSTPFSVLLAIRGHKNIVQIVHDATQAGCPSAWTIYRNNFGKCNIKMSFGKCMKHCAYDKPKLDFSIYYLRLKIFLYMKKKLIRKYISPSVALKNILQQNGFNPVVALGNSIQFNITSKYHKENILLYVGAIDKRKGIDKLISAINEMEQIKKDWKFVIIGEGEILEDLKKDFGNNFFHFLGKVENHEVMNLFRKSKIAFVPSIWFENYPTVAIEGVLNENIVLGTANGGFREIAGDNNIFNIHDKEDIKTKINDVISQYTEYYKETLKHKKELIDKMNNYITNLEKELMS